MPAQLTRYARITPWWFDGCHAARSPMSGRVRIRVVGRSPMVIEPLAISGSPGVVGVTVGRVPALALLRWPPSLRQVQPSRLILNAARAASFALAAVIGALTLSERAFLKSVGWSPVHRTPTEWPSLLALGPNGWVLTVSFVVAGALGAVVGIELRRVASAGGLRNAASLFAVMNVALIFVAFSADAPHSGRTTWHARVHDTAYPILVTTAAISMVLMAASHGADEPWRTLRVRSRLILPALLGGVIVSNIDTIAQTGRYLLIGGLIGWSQWVARAPGSATRRRE